MAARNVSLTPHLTEFVELNVSSGRFQNASEVVREALRLLERQQQADQLKLERLRQAIALGRSDAAEGRIVTVGADRIGDFLRGLGDEPSD